MQGQQEKSSTWSAGQGRSGVATANRISYNETDFGRLSFLRKNNVVQQEDDIENRLGTMSDDEDLHFEDALMEEDFHEYPPASTSSYDANLPLGSDERSTDQAVLLYSCTPTPPVMINSPVTDTQDDDDDEDFDMEVDWDGRSVSTSSSYYRYDIILEPTDIVCGRGVYRSSDHPGNITMYRIVQPYILPFGKATRDQERKDIVANILAEVMGNRSYFAKSPSFLVPAPYYEGLVYCRAATAEEIETEIHHCIHLHFNLIPTPQDVLFGRGEPIRDHPGNKKLRAYILPRRKAYAASSNKKAMVQAAMDIITESKGRFLLPYNKTILAEGCILADTASVKEKIAHLFRNKKLSLDADLDNDEERAAVPSAFINHFSAALAPKSKTTSTSSITNTKETDTTLAETPPCLIKIQDGPSISSTLDVHREDCQESQTMDSANTLPSRRFLAKCTKHHLAFAIILLTGAIVAGTVFGTKSRKSSPNAIMSQNESSFTLRTILDRGYIICGITDQEGYATRDATTGQWEGFDVDLCRAVAAGIFGKEKFARRDQNLSARAAEPVKFVNLKASERFIVLNEEKVDLLLAITTQNMERNVHEPTTRRGYTFSTPYLVNGLIFGGHPDYLDCFTDWNSTFNGNSTDLGHCEDAILCVLNGTTHQDFIEKTLHGISSRLYTPSTMDLLYDYLIQGVCNVLAGEQLELAPSMVEKQGYSGPYQIGDEIFSKELISMVTRDGDAKFSDFCNWQIKGLFAAEEMRILGASKLSPSDLLTTLAFGERYKGMFQDAFEVVGDYGELYDRHLEELMPRFDANRINLGDMPGMYAIEFGTVQTSNPPSKTDSPKIREVKQRRLNCGITETPIFAELNADDWIGLDVDYCKAISAALFDGKTTEVTYWVLDPSDRFEALRSGHVDVLARVTTLTMERDVHEKTTGQGFSFSFPNFHDRIRFAGNSKYIKCAEKRDWKSSSCSDLQICVTASTTQHDLLSRIFPSNSLVLSDSTSENVESFSDGKCQVLAAGSVEISKASIEKYHVGEYEIGSQALSRESLALVTTEDDPLWSKFVNWVGIGLVYAEEKGITQDTFYEMPRIDLFGPLIGDQMLRHAIRAVGSYGEVWERNAGVRDLERDGRNQLNTNPLGPMLISDLTWDHS